MTNRQWQNRAARVACAGALASIAALPALADTWDTAGEGTAGTTANVLWHTAPAQRHDLANTGGTSDQDWYKIFPRANRSYEVQVVNVSVSMAAAFSVTRNSTGGGLIDTSVGLDATGATRALRWVQGAADTEERVASWERHRRRPARSTTSSCARRRSIARATTIPVRRPAC